MKKARKIIIKNGDLSVPFFIYKCSHCNRDLPESAPREEIDNKVYCGDCAYILGLIEEKDYIKTHLYFLSVDNVRAVVRNGEIHVGTGKFPWERKSRARNSKEYSEWRNKVFERDSYTCQCCGQVGGTLNAHHIKEYAKHPDLRLVISNGITLCEKCHKSLHKGDISLNGGVVSCQIEL